MAHPIHPNGSTILCYEIEVPIPPPGVTWDPYDKKWVDDGVYSRSSNKADQYWEPIVPSFDFRKEERKEKIRQVQDPEYIDQRLEGWRNDCWARRDRGMWFMNNGEPIYITGQHYFYLNDWHLDIGLPRFMINPDWKFFLLMWYAQNDPNSFGVIEAAMRRSGKSYRAMSTQYEVISRNYEHHGGIQSKTGEDAKKFYNKMLKGFKKLSSFWIPDYDTDGIKSGIHFTVPFKRGKRIEIDDSDSLDSSITFESADMQAYDSSKMHFYIRDEAGKSQANNQSVYDLWQVVRPTLTQGTSKIIGTAIFTSTIEEAGSDAFEALWKDSDPNNRNKNNRTTSGLYRFFTPCYDSDVEFTDRYGYCDADSVKEFQMNERESLRSDPKKLANHIRKYPFTIEEAFYRNADKSPFDVIKLNGWLEQLEWGSLDDLTLRGDLSWEDGVEDTKLIFAKNPRGKYLFNKLIDPEDKKWNITDLESVRPKPVNKTSLVVGVDPYDHKIIDIGYKSQMSQGACYVFHKSDGLDKELSDSVLCEYIGRPEDPDVFFEDMRKLCIFFSTEVLVERNKSGMNNYFDRKGYGHWLKKEKGRKERGVSAGTGNKDQSQEAISTFITNNEDVRKIPFPMLIRDLIDFDPSDSKKNDAGMAFGWALFAAYRIDRNFTKNRAVEDAKNKSTLKSILKRL
jgi:hypothetical protein